MQRDLHTHTATSWQALQYFNMYRFLLALLFVVLIWSSPLPEPLGSHDEILFVITCHLYLLLATIIVFFLHIQLPKYTVQVATHVLLDILMTSLMMYSSNGVNSGFGVLLIVAVTGGSILYTGKMAFVFAATATLIVLGQEVYVQFFRYILLPNYTHAGFLGVAFFMTAFLGQALAAKAEKSAIDLKHLGQLNAHIVKQMQSGLIFLDANNQVALWNEAARYLLGLDVHYHKLQLQKNVPELFACVENWQNKNDPSTVVFKPLEGDMEIQASFTRLNIGSKFGILIFLEDVAQIRQHAQNLKIASLGRLSASIAHEVRNPLGAISHASQLLSESEYLSQEDKRLANIITDHTQRVNRIIENMIGISRRKVAIPEHINISQWMRNFIAEFSQQKQLKANDIYIGKALDTVVVRMDVSQLTQVLWNLSENALRYSRAQPRIEYQWGVRSATGKPYLDVMDHGLGISADVIPQLYEPFFTTDTDGSGLGLYISKELCEANQASLVLHNNTPKGCCFRIHFARVENH